LRERWRGLWRRIGAAGNPDAVFDRIAEAYGEAQRGYHTLDHVADCLARLDKNRELALNSDEVETALWLHDVVYTPGAFDNEERSAAWGKTVLRNAGLAELFIGSVRKLILATSHAAPPEEADSALIADIDLSILGASGAAYEAYEALIRWECRSVPETEFRRRRLRNLKSFLAREFIYSTLPFRRKLEQQARKNLAWSIARLKG